MTLHCCPPRFAELASIVTRECIRDVPRQTPRSSAAFPHHKGLEDIAVRNDGNPLYLLLLSPYCLRPLQTVFQIPVCLSLSFLSTRILDST